MKTQNSDTSIDITIIILGEQTMKDHVLHETVYETEILNIQGTDKIFLRRERSKKKTDGRELLIT